jgi:hypothetical protein
LSATIGLTQIEIQTLKLFNEKAELVINSKYGKESKEKELGITYTYNGDPEVGMKVSRVGHDPDYRDSVLMKIRMFRVEEDAISLKNMTSLYDSMKIDPVYKQAFHESIDYLNYYLGEPATTLLDDKPTRGRLFDVFLFGDISHINDDKTPVYRQWKEDEFSFTMAENEFELIIHEYINIVGVIKKLDDLILKKYGVP